MREHLFTSSLSLFFCRKLICLDIDETMLVHLNNKFRWLFTQYLTFTSDTDGRYLMVLAAHNIEA
jgi:hypothetical protein